LSLESPLTRLIGLKLPSGERIVGDHSIAIGGYEDAGRAGGLGVKSVIGEPTVELRLSAGKARSIVRTTERLRTAIGH